MFEHDSFVIPDAIRGQQLRFSTYVLYVDELDEHMSCTFASTAGGIGRRAEAMISCGSKSPGTSLEPRVSELTEWFEGL